MPEKLTLHRIQQKLNEIAVYLGKVANHLPLNIALDHLRDLGLLEGMDNEIQNSEFLRRLKEHPEEKQAIAAFLNREAVDGGFPSLLWDSFPYRRMFFESGSTIAFPIGEFARRLAADDQIQLGYRAPIEVLTNNLFALTALANLVKSVAPVNGSLVTKYYGFFTSAEENEHPNSETEPALRAKLWKKEVEGYRRLRDDVAECDVILATCSNFSFLAGPLVGSRGNAIAKHAIYTGKHPEAQLAVALHFEKLIGMTGNPIDIPMQAPKKECYCVFPLSESKRKKLADTIHQLEERNWHHHWGKGAKVAAIEVLEAAADHHLVLKQSEFADTWIEKAAGNRLLVGLPHDNLAVALSWIQREVDHANRALSPVHRVGYQINEKVNPFESKVVEILIVS